MLTLHRYTHRHIGTLAQTLIPAYILIHTHTQTHLPILDNVRDLAIGLSVWHTHTHTHTQNKSTQNAATTTTTLTKSIKLATDSIDSTTTIVTAKMPVLLHCCHMAELHFAYVGDCYIPFKASKVAGN